MSTVIVSTSVEGLQTILYKGELELIDNCFSYHEKEGGFVRIDFSEDILVTRINGNDITKLVLKKDKGQLQLISPEATLNQELNIRNYLKSKEKISVEYYFDVWRKLMIEIKE